MRTRSDKKYCSKVVRPTTSKLTVLRKKSKVLDKNISLRSYGYSIKFHPELRRLALIKSVLRHGYHDIRERLEILRVFNLDSRNRAYFCYKNDLKFIEKIWGDSDNSVKNVVNRKFLELI